MISDMITRSAEKASVDDAHNANHSDVRSQADFQLYACRDRNDALHYRVTAQRSVPDDLDDFPRIMHSWPEVMNIPFDLASNTISYREMLNFLEAYLSCTGFDACSLQPINSASGEYADLLVIRKYQKSIGQDLGMKSAHGTKPDSAVTSHIDMKMKSCQSQGASLEKLMSVQQELRRTRQETEDVKENKLKDLIIVHCNQFDNEMVAVKSGMVGRASSLKMSSVMLKWTRLMRTVNVWRRTTLCAKRR